MKPVVDTRTRRCRRRRGPLGLALFLMVVLGAIPMSSSTVRAAPPTLTIVSPADNSSVASDASVTIRFTVTDFVLVQPGRVGQVAVPGEGHANVFLDDRYVRLVTRVEPFSLTLSSGNHTIRMQLVDHNGAPLSPDVSDSVSVIASHGPLGTLPRIEILSPAANDRVGHGTYVTFRVENFALVEPRGQPNVPNEGHVQVLVLDHIAMGVIRYGPVLVVGLPEGDATITVRLVHNDGTPLTNPDASATVPIHVVASSAVTLPLVFNGGMTLLLAFVLVVLALRRRKAAAREGKARGGEA